jgi:hypothetical protein
VNVHNSDVNGNGGQGFFSLARLKASPKWKICAFLVANVAAVTYPFGSMSRSLEITNFLLSGTTGIFVMLSDAAFSVAATAIFLRPVLEVDRMAKGVVRSAASKRMHKTKNSTLAGERAELHRIDCEKSMGYYVLERFI